MSNPLDKRNRLFPYDPALGVLPPPDTYPDDAPLVCVAINQDWIPLVLGVLERLCWSDAYNGTEAENELAARKGMHLQGMLVGLRECCCDMKALRNSPSDDLMVQYQDCDGIWHDGFSMPGSAEVMIYNTYQSSAYTTLNDLRTIYQGDITNIWTNGNDTNDADRNAVLCVLIDTIVKAAVAEAKKLLHTQGHARQSRIAAAFAAALEICGDIIALLAETGLIATPEGGFLALLVGLSAALFAGLSVLYALMPDGDSSALDDDDAINDVVCCIFSNLDGQTISLASWGAALQACLFTPGSHQYIIGQAVSIAASSEDAFLPSLAIASDLYDAAIENLIALPCGCNEYCYHWSFLADLPAWTILHGAPHVDTPHNEIAIDFASSTQLLSVTVYMSGVGSGSSYLRIYATINQAEQLLLDTTLHNGSRVWLGNEPNATNLRIDGSRQFAWNLVGVEIRGSGVRPFGDDTCA